MSDTPLNSDALEAMSRVVASALWEVIDLYPDDPRTPNYRKYAMDKAGLSMSAYLAVAQPEAQRKLAISVKALGLVASLHTAVESIELGQECRICSIPYPCMTRRVADEALQAIEREVKP